jgi:hypothetical protein
MIYLGLIIFTENPHSGHMKKAVRRVPRSSVPNFDWHAPTSKLFARPGTARKPRLGLGSRGPGPREPSSRALSPRGGLGPGSGFCEVDGVLSARTCNTALRDFLHSRSIENVGLLECGHWWSQRKGREHREYSERAADFVKQRVWKWRTTSMYGNILVNVLGHEASSVRCSVCVSCVSERREVTESSVKGLNTLSHLPLSPNVLVPP